MMPPTLDLVVGTSLFTPSRDAPDSLEDNETSPDSVRGYLHYVDLADNLQYTDSCSVAELGKSLGQSNIICFIE
jgi:hypothetical protein